MKSIATVVIMVVAAIAEASYIPLNYAHHGYNYVAAPVATYDAHHAWDHPGYSSVETYNSYVHHVPATAAGYEHQWDHHHHHAPAVAVVAPVQHSATYVAANPGAVHKAPLPGHAVNQKSLNLAPAPGTW